MENYKFNKGDKIIWDSHFGYEIGYFLGDGAVYHTYLVDVISGIITGRCSYSKDEIHQYSVELSKSLSVRYNINEKIF